MQNSDELIIRIANDLKITVEETAGDIVSFKEIAPDTFFNCIKNSLEYTTVSSGILPQGCFSFSVDRNGTRQVSILFNELKIDLSYEKTLYRDFSIPRLIFGFSVSKDGAIIGTNVGVVEDAQLTPNTKMYRYPFSNVSGLHLCIGSNSMPKISMLNQLNGIPYYVLSMPDNNDHYDKNNTKQGLEYRELLEHLKDKTSRYYYDNVLIESGFTVSDFIKL